MALSVAVPPAVSAWLHTQSSDGSVRNVRPTFGGFSNLTFFATLGGDEVVVKAASDERKRADVSREARMLTMLADADLGPSPPAPLLRAHTDAEGWAISILGVIPGETGLSVLQTSGEALLERRSVTLGRLLRSVHRSAPLPPRGGGADFDLEARAAVIAEELSSAALPPGTVASLRAALQHRAVRTGVALVHGDFGFHNTLWTLAESGPVDGRGAGGAVGASREDANTGGAGSGGAGRDVVAGLVDWEWSGWGNPLVDLAWLWWTLRFRMAPQSAFDGVVDGYGRAAVRALGWSDDAVLALVRAQMAQIVVRTPVDSPPREEWLRRIERLTLLHVPAIV